MERQGRKEKLPAKEVLPSNVFDDKILDGRNRYRACKAAKVEPTTKAFRGTDPLAYVLDQNLHRWHLDESQRSMVATRVATLAKGEKKADGSIDLSQADAAKKLNVSVPSVKRARKVLDKASLN